MNEIVVLLAEGFEEIEAVTPIDILRRAGISVITVGINGTAIKGSHGIILTADTTIEDLSGNIDISPYGVIIPGGMPGSVNIAESRTACSFITGINNKSGLIAAICAAPALVLSPLGILNGKSATCYPGCETSFSDKVLFSENNVVMDGNIITSRGAGTASEFALAIIRYLIDDKTAKAFEKTLLLNT